MLTYMRRLLAEAEHVGCTRYAAALTNLLAAPPKTLYEVLCLSHIMLNVEELGRERCRSYGAIDELYMPYFVADLESGRETEASVKEMFRYFWQKVTAEKRYADQPICIGKAWTSAGLSMLREVGFGVGLVLLFPIWFGLYGMLWFMAAADILTFILCVFVILRVRRELQSA